MAAVLCSSPETPIVSMLQAIPPTGQRFPPIRPAENSYSAATCADGTEVFLSNVFKFECLAVFAAEQISPCGERPKFGNIDLLRNSASTDPQE